MLSSLFFCFGNQRFIGKSYTLQSVGEYIQNSCSQKERGENIHVEMTESEGQSPSSPIVSDAMTTKVKSSEK